jgi:putative flippase GtrA
MAGGIRAWVPELIRFGQVGALVFVTYLAGSMFLSRVIGLDQVAAAVIGTTFSAVVSYFGHGSYTFDRDLQHRVMLPRFLASVAMAYALSYVVAAGLTAWTVWPDYAVYLAAVCAVVAANFIVFRFWVFVAGRPRD